MKTLSVRQFASIKRVAQNVNPLVVKKNKITIKIEELKEEYEALVKEIEAHEMGVKSLTDGYLSEDLVTKVIEDTGKFDKKGNPIKITKYEPNDKVYYDEENKVYVIKEDPVEESIEEEVKTSSIFETTEI